VALCVTFMFVRSHACVVDFSYFVSWETVTFTNYSDPGFTTYWNFGDGTGSYFKEPVHTFPESGEYLVVLYAIDEEGLCSGHKEEWITIQKYLKTACQPGFTEYFIYGDEYDLLQMNDASVDCVGYMRRFDGGPASNFTPGLLPIYLDPSFKPAQFVDRVRWYGVAPDTSLFEHRAFYRSNPYDLDLSDAHGPCSANFEFTSEPHELGQLVRFKAMNSNALSYQWEIMGFGNPIYQYSDTTSKVYPYTWNDRWLVRLEITGADGCKATMTHHILIRPDVITTSIREQSPRAADMLLRYDQAAALLILDDNELFNQIMMHDINGRIVMSTGNIRVIDIAHLANGVYTVTGTNTHTSRSARFVRY
jgi:PKD repeat protein